MCNYCNQFLRKIKFSWNGECFLVITLFTDTPIDFGKLMVSKELDLIYGYGKTGLMGCVAKAVHDGGRNVLGIMPRFFSGILFSLFTEKYFLYSFNFSSFQTLS